MNTLQSTIRRTYACTLYYCMRVQYLIYDFLINTHDFTSDFETELCCILTLHHLSGVSPALLPIRSSYHILHQCDLVIQFHFAALNDNNIYFEDDIKISLGLRTHEQMTGKSAIEWRNKSHIKYQIQ